MNEQIQAAIPRDRAGEFVVPLAEAIGAHAGAATAFPQPISQNGTTVIPVARARWGFGGGQVDKQTRKGENSGSEIGGGGGGGGTVTPVGYIVLRNGEVRYHRITTVPALLLAALAGAAVAMLLRR